MSGSEQSQGCRAGPVGVGSTKHGWLTQHAPWSQATLPCSPQACIPMTCTTLVSPILTHNITGMMSSSSCRVSPAAVVDAASLSFGRHVFQSIQVGPPPENDPCARAETAAESCV